MADEILGTTTVSPRWRISLIKAVREELDGKAGQVSVGDRLVYRKVGDQIIIETA